MKLEKTTLFTAATLAAILTVAALPAQAQNKNAATPSNAELEMQIKTLEARIASQLNDVSTRIDNNADRIDKNVNAINDNEDQVVNHKRMFRTICRKNRLTCR